MRRRPAIRNKPSARRRSGCRRAAPAFTTSIIQRVSDQLLTTTLAKQSSAHRPPPPRTTICNNCRACSARSAAAAPSPTPTTISSRAMQTESATPEDPVAQSAAVNAGQQLAQQLNQFSSGIQSLRANADSDIGTVGYRPQYRPRPDRRAQRLDRPGPGRGTIDRDPPGSARPGAQPGRAAHGRHLL